MAFSYLYTNANISIAEVEINKGMYSVKSVTNGECLWSVKSKRQVPVLSIGAQPATSSKSEINAPIYLTETTASFVDYTIKNPEKYFVKKDNEYYRIVSLTKILDIFDGYTVYLEKIDRVKVTF